LLSCVGYTKVEKFRNVDPLWLKNNPACTHRLNHFLSRELKAIESLMPKNSTNRLNLQLRLHIIPTVVNLVKKFHIESDEFLEELSTLIRPKKYALHFRYELVSYAKSICHSLIEYDAKVVYYASQERMLGEKSEFPFKYMPINVTKYKLTEPSSSQLDAVDSSVLLLPAELTVEPAQNRQDSSLDSDQSSFCEVISPPPKKAPVEIVIRSTSSCSDTSTDYSSDERPRKVNINFIQRTK
jgi:hypothetical protein